MLLARLIRFRREVVTLWHAFWNPLTPFYLKLATVLTVLYLVSPFDLIPEVLPVIGLLDDIVIVPLVVSWIVSRLPQQAPAYARTDEARRNDAGGKVIDGTWRRL